MRSIIRTPRAAPTRAKPPSPRAQAIFRAHLDAVTRHTDRLFAVLMAAQLLAGIGIALWITPLTWIGEQSQVHTHVITAIVLGTLIATLPIGLVVLAPGTAATRHSIAIAQMLFGGLLIHLAGGRIEMHFHVFGSLAFLAFYRDWRVLITASAVVALDHMIRGHWWPQSIFGVADATDWRWIEHTAWVVFLDAFLIVACRRNIREMRTIAERQAEIEQAGTELEARVVERTAQFEAAKLEAEEAARVKTEFLANMSHEIRTPMTAIRGYADLLLSTDGEDSITPQQRREHLHTIHRNSDHLLAIINDILDISKIEAGRMTVEHIPVSLEQILFDLESIMRVKADNKDIAFNIQCETPLPKTILSDPVRLLQILNNLTGNAIKFTKQGGVVIAITLEHHTATPTIRFAVTDTGIGMTKPELAKLFLPFSQADTSTTRRYGGTGLGLRISRRLAQLLKGDITVHSVPNQGSTFTLTIPTGPLDTIPLINPEDSGHAVRRSTPRHPSRSTNETPLHGARIYFAEDAPDNQRLIAYHLRKAGAHITIFNNGLDCLNALTQSGDSQGPLLDSPPCDLVLTDIQMPAMDGYTLATRLRAKGWKKPIIALTAHAMIGDQQRCLEAGCDDYATKPIDEAELIQTCADWLPQCISPNQ